jgi:hypothetical protein
MSLIFKKKIINYLIPFFLSIFVIFLSLDQSVWFKFWGTLNIPASIPFSDLEALNIFLSYKQDGFNPYIESPQSHSVHKVMMYPSIWLSITEILNLQNPINFIFFCFIILYLYFYILLNMAFKINDKKFFLILALFFFSTSNFLLIERLNIEMIIFCIIYFALMSNKIWTQISFFLSSIVFKLFPIFSVFIFINRIKYFFLIITICLFYTFFMRHEILMILNNSIEYALIFAYGITSIAKGIYYYSTEFGYFINEKNYPLLKNSLILISMMYAISIFFINFRFKKNEIMTEISIEEKMFLSGAGIYIGTYITSTNIDYRLCFLIFTIPFLMSQKNFKMINLYLLLITICFNSLIFEGGNTYSLFYFAKAFIIYLLKFIIFTVNCYYFGFILSKFINFNFLKFKK